MNPIKQIRRLDAMLEQRAERLANNPLPPANPKPEPNPLPLREPTGDLSDYVLLKEHPQGLYPDLLIAAQRTHLGSNWNNTHPSLEQEGTFMLPLYIFPHFIRAAEDTQLYDSRGNRLSSRQSKKLFDDITERRDPVRSEWLDAKFTKTGTMREKWMMAYHRFKSNGVLEEVTEPLAACLRKDKTPGIDLAYWLKNPTSQGLPSQQTPDGSLYYWHPGNGTVARLDAVAGGVVLYCYGGPQYSDSGLGVRAAKKITS